jgi:hypothetical protein
MKHGLQIENMNAMATPWYLIGTAYVFRVSTKCCAALRGVPLSGAIGFGPKDYVHHPGAMEHEPENRHKLHQKDSVIHSCCCRRYESVEPRRPTGQRDARTASIPTAQRQLGAIA